MISERDVRTALQTVVKRDEVWTWDVAFDFREGTLDSLDHATLALYLDEHCGLQIADAELAELRSIESILAFARRQQDR